MGLFSRNKPEPKPDPQPALSPEEEMERKFYMQIPENGALVDSVGTNSIDELLKIHAPMHELRLNRIEQKQDQILANQQRILEELANLRRFYQTPEKASAPSYFQSGTR